MDGFMGCIFRPIIGGNGNKSRGLDRVWREVVAFKILVAITSLASEGRPDPPLVL